MKHALAAACLYEAGAVWTGRYPTITGACGRHPLLAVAIVVALIVHLVVEAARVRRLVHASL